MAQKQFADKGLKAHALYSSPQLFKAVLKVAIPGLLISLMSGIYVFADQLLLSLLVPQDPMHGWDSIFGRLEFNGKPVTRDVIEQWLATINPEIKFEVADTKSIVKSAVAITLPIMMVINAVPNIAAIGAGSMYGQCIAKDNKPKALQIWKSTFYCAIFIGLISSLIFYSINDSILKLMAGAPNHYDGNILPDKDKEILNEYFQIANDTQILWSHQFLDILSWSSILNVFILYFSFMVRAEGRLAFVTTAEMSCNLFNILFDYIYISLCHTGMMGGGLATLTGWSMNVIVYAVYILYLGHKGETWMKYSDLLPNHGSKMSFSILVPIVIIGLSVFLRNFTNSIANTTFMTVLGATATKCGDDSQYWQGLSGTVWPVGSLFFYAVFGIADGVRTLAAYNYARNKINRIRRAYWYSTLLSFIYGIVVYTLLATWLGGVLISWFNLDAKSTADAITYMRIQVLFIPMVALSIGGLLIFQATNQMLMATFIAMLQGCLTFPLSAGVMYTVATHFNNVLYLVIANPLNTGSAGIIITIISIIYMYRFLGNTRFKIKVNMPNNKTISYKCVVPSYIKKQSYAERELEKSISASTIR